VSRPLARSWDAKHSWSGLLTDQRRLQDEQVSLSLFSPGSVNLETTHTSLVVDLVLTAWGQLGTRAKGQIAALWVLNEEKEDLTVEQSTLWKTLKTFALVDENACCHTESLEQDLKAECFSES